MSVNVASLETRVVIDTTESVVNIQPDSPDSGGGIPESEKGAPNGVATLGADGKLSSAQLVGTYASVLPLKGRYCRLGGDGAISVNAPANNILRIGQFSVPYDIEIDRIGVAWDIAGEASAKVRIGVYGPLLPDMALEDVPLLFDAGFVDGSQASGQYYITVDQFIKAGIYFSATLNYDSPTTRPRMRCTSAGASVLLPFGSFGTGEGFVTNQQIGFQATVTGGALPVDFGSVVFTEDRCNLVQARIKA